MNRVRMYYASEYSVPGVATLSRLGAAFTLLEAEGLVDSVAPPAFDPECLRGLHVDQYLHDFVQGNEPLASSQGIPWTPRVRDAAFSMLSGQLAGAAHALQHGLAMNLARGFHHAVPERGAAYCPLNGLALIAHCHPGVRVMIIDCDEHGGNGTEEFAARMANLHNASIFGTRFGCRGGVRSHAFPVRVREGGFESYLTALSAVEQLVDQIEPDLVVYQAGTDCHRDDPKSQAGLSTEQLMERDLAVFRMARSRSIPMLFVVAGGYQTAYRLAHLNANTVRAALKVWSEH